MIRDLEELLLRVVDASSREFMTEAVRSYYAGAYRAAVVMAVGAGFDDLRRKLEKLSASGAPTQSIIQATKLIGELFEQQKPYERALIEAAGKGVGMISPSQQKKLRTLLDVRNLCAHPSGHISSSEEARDAIASVVDIVLSQPGLMGAVAAKELSTRVTKKSFFPSLGSVEDAFLVVERELELISPQSMGLLAKTLCDEILDCVRDGGESLWLKGLNKDSSELDSLALFIGGMLSLDGPSEAAVLEQIPRLVMEDDADFLTSWLLSVKPSVIRLLDNLDRDRAVTLVESRRDIDKQCIHLVDEWARLNLI